MADRSLGLACTEEQDALQRTLFDWLRVAGFPRQPEFDAQLSASDLWSDINDDIGVVGITVPEELGGVGGTLRDACAALEELGASLYPGPLVTAIPATQLLIAAHAASNGLIAGHLSGTAPVTVVDLDVALDSSTAPRLTARSNATGTSVSGSTAPFITTENLAVVFAPAQLDDDIAVVAIELQSDQTALTPLRSLDLSRTWGRLECSEAQARVLAVGDEARELLDMALRTALVCLASEQLGVARQSFTNTLAYLVDRYQFGRAIGSFQALKHKMVDTYVLCQQAYASVDHALASVEGTVPTRIDAMSALILANRAAVSTTMVALQLAGGIGMTWEHSPHLYLRRAVTGERAFGGIETMMGLLTEAVLLG